jgi:hypothetical protein
MRGVASTSAVHLFARHFLCAALLGPFTGCSSTNGRTDPTGNHPDAMVDGGAGRDAGRDGGPPKTDGGKPPQAGTDGPSVLAGPTSISPSGGSAVGNSDNYRLQVVVGAPAPMNEGSSDNLKLRIGARVQ